MTDITDDETLDSLPDSQLEKDPEQNIPALEAGGITLKQESANMDTHAQHLHHAPGKKFRHYFYEFLMLFLAVFCGFLAENLREHTVEKARAKEFAKTLIQDLSGDTTELLDVIREDKIVLGCFDSINAIIQKRSKDKTVPGSFYYYCNIGTWSPTVVWNNSTLTQIIHSGGLRYFANQELVKKLSYYFSQSDFISIQNSIDSRYRDESIKIRSRILNNYFYSWYSAFMISSWLKIPDSLLKTRISLQNDDPGLLNEFANSLEARKRLLNLLVTRDYADALKIASALILLLRKDYHLD